jgi:hypothetical protein
MVKTNAESGYIALLAVLIMGAATLAIGLSLLASGTDSQRMVLIEQHTTRARGLANACMEEALQFIHDTPTYVGTTNVTVGTDTCQYTVTSTGASTRTVDASAVISNITRRVRVYATMTATSISIISWQEVSGV